MGFPTAWLLAAVLLPCGVGGAVAADVKGKPNIVFIMADDHTSQAWGCYGSRLAAFAKTPNIDRLAREGARLTNCFCTNSICVPSRASILTGQYSHVNGVKTLREALDPGADNVAKRLQRAGYQTALVGKWHLKKSPAGFDYWNIIKGQGRYHNPVMYEMDLDGGAVQQGAYSTDVFTDKALDWLARRDREKPFCLMLHFKATHEPWQYHPRHAKLYENVVLPEPKTLLGPTGPTGGVVPGWPLELLTQRMLKGGHGGGRLRVTSDDPQVVRRATYQKFVKDFLRCVAAIDENIGRVLEHLDKHQLAEDTVVIYTSDQGYFLGEHNYFDKRFMLEESLRMPLVVRYPGEIEPQTVVEDIILNVDFAPTFLDYAGTGSSPTMQGRSFRANLAGNSPADWRGAMYYRYYAGSPQRPAHFGIRTHRYKLIYYDGLKDQPEGQRWELYDLTQDPQETRNAYGDSKHREITAELKQRLRDLQAELGDRAGAEAQREGSS
ncbi:MAG: sulfatase [Candidatus Nealsonbacteria bacterium]|nr:sulfatase [Candidatus Nealsonbacteria bacterium]